MAFAANSAADLQVNPVLTNIARLYRPAGRIYDQICVGQPVDKISNLYIVWDERDWFTNVDNNKVTDQSPAPEIEVHWSTDNFNCEDYALKVGITPREEQQSRNVGDLDKLRQRKVSALMDQMANQREKRIATVLKKTTNGGQLTLGGNATTAFASAAAGVIETDWETAKSAAYVKTGHIPNTAIIPYQKAVDMANNVALRDIFKYFINSEGFIALGENPNAPGAMILPRVFHGTRIIVPFGALAQTGHEGAAKSFSDVWGTSTRFIYIPEGGTGEDQAGNLATAYSFSHPVLSSDAAATQGSGPVVSTYRTVDPTKEYVLAEECFDEKVTAPDLAYELANC
jgi:hypothetical protein